LTFTFNYDIITARLEREVWTRSLLSLTYRWGGRKVISVIFPRDVYDILRYFPDQWDLDTASAELAHLYQAREPFVSDWQQSVQNDLAVSNFHLWMRLNGTIGIDNKLSSTAQTLYCYVLDALRRAYEMKGLSFPVISTETINHFNSLKGDILYANLQELFEEQANNPNSTVGTGLSILDPQQQTIMIKVLSALLWLINSQLASELTSIVVIAT
jgi:hypothetical protein